MSYESDVVSATSGRGEPDWDKIIKLCNRIRDSVGTLSMAQAMGSVMRRVKHTDSNIQLHALTLLESCVSNCGQDFQLELTKSTFHSDVKNILAGPYVDPRVKQRLRELLSSWTTEFKTNTKMTPLIKFVETLRREGGQAQPSVPAAPSTGPQPTPAAAQASSREDADLKKAIQLSLLDANPIPPSSTPTMYPSIGSTPAPTQKQPQKKVAKKRVRAIYDFVAAEDNELSFRAGEILTVLDDTDENWWRGETQLGKGLFPASFVSTNLSVEPQPSSVERKENQTTEKAQSKKSKGGDAKKVVVNEEKIDLLLDMIKGADVTSDENKAENETLMELEGECKKMKPLIDETVAALQTQEDEMVEINKKFDEALAMYRKLLSEGPRLSSGALPQKQPSSVTAQPQPGLSEPTHYPTQPHTALPPQAQPHTPHPPQAQPHIAHPPQAQPHTAYSPQARPHSAHATQAQPQTTLPPQAQPPPYTTNSPYTTQTGYPGELSLQPSAMEQPSSLSYGGLMMGGSSQTPVSMSIKPPTLQQSYYSRQPDPVPAQTTLRSGPSPSLGVPLMSATPQSVPTTIYQPPFYPQQQSTHLVQQPLL